jgi:hypothetical protein
MTGTAAGRQGVPDNGQQPAKVSAASAGECASTTAIRFVEPIAMQETNNCNPAADVIDHS